MFRRLPWQRLTPLLLIGLVAGCSSQPPATPPKAAESTPAAKSGAETKPAPQTGASPTAGVQTAPAASPARVEPKGRVLYAFHTSLSPAWLDPQENPAVITPYVFQYAMHDAMVKHLPGQPFAPSLAESYQIADDQKSATFKLRPGVKFHNGDPVTPEDVKYTFEKYRGANAKILKDKVDRIETPDAQTVRFVFKEPFLDFLILYGSPASGAGWIVPKKYYEEVGPDAFKQKPIGAGPYKFVRQISGNEIEFEAVPDYWRKTPAVKTLIIRGVAEEATRVAALQSGEVDVMNQVTGPLIDTVKSDPNLTLAPVLGSPFWLEMPGLEKPDNPFNNVKVRQAMSLAIDRDAINQAESQGLSIPLGNWIPNNWPGAIEWPVFPHDLARARQLMAEAGYPNGFEVEQVTPLPPYNSLAERVISQIREIGIRAKLNIMERAAFNQKMTEGPEAFKGMIVNISGAPGDAASRIRAFAICPPKGSTSRTCVPEIDEKFERYEKSADPREREKLLTEIQTYMLENHVFIPLYRQAFILAVGPRIANKWEEIAGAIPQYGHLGPYEDIRLKE